MVIGLSFSAWSFLLVLIVSNGNRGRVKPGPVSFATRSIPCRESAGPCRFSPPARKAGHGLSLAGIGARM